MQERLRKLEEVFDAVVDQLPAERARTLAGVDETLRAEVETLLANAAGNDRVPGIVARSAGRTKRATMAGRRLGPYRIDREIGAGGMGAVYLATRDDEQYQTQVAIKVLHRGLQSEQAVARFRDERQILATLDHPNIVRLLDGGTSDGAPYLVMEHVPGESISRYAAAQKLTIAERVDLFRKVCAAVHYAHGKLIVHRDLKPSNILVTADGTPKLLDFGIAKLLEASATGPRREAETRTGMLLLTPEYASPEQARGEPVSIASDVYSLGAVFYELVTGRPAHKFEGSSFNTLRLLLETAPALPSSVAPAEHKRALVGDLDNVILKALDKDAARRYPSAEHFAEDLRRHLDGLPVEARAATWSYRAGKFVRRNRLGVAAAGAMALALAGATVVSVYQAGLARDSQRDAEEQTRVAVAATARAEHRFAEVRAIAHTLVFDVDDSIANLSGSTAARELIVSRALAYLDRLAAEANGDRDLQRELAAAYVKIGDIQGSPQGPNLGRPADAQKSYARAIELIGPLGPTGDHSPDTQVIRAEAMLGLAIVDGEHFRSNLAPALDVLRDVPESVASLHARTRILASMYDNVMADGGGDVAAIAAQCEQAATAWARIDPTSTDARLWLGIANELAGDASGVGAADPDAAIVAYDAAHATFAALVATHPDQASFNREITNSRTRLGMYHSGYAEGLLWLPSDGDLAAAEHAVRDAIAREMVAIARDPNDMREKGSLLSSLAQLSWIVPDERLASLEHAKQILDSEPPEAQNEPQEIVLSWLLSCSLPPALATAGHATEARTALAEARARSAAAAALDPFAEVQCGFLIAETERTLGDSATALAAFAKVEATLRSKLVAKPDDIISRIGLVETLQREAELEPARRCARLADAATVWKAWPKAATPYTTRRQKALDDASTGCH